MQKICKDTEESDSHEPSWNLRKNMPRMEQGSYCEKLCKHWWSPERSPQEKRPSFTKNGKVAQVKRTWTPKVCKPNQTGQE